MARYRAIPPERWGEIKALWKTGKFAQVTQLHNFLKEGGLATPTVSSIRMQMANDGNWDRSTIYMETQRRIEEESQLAFIRANVPHDSVIQDVADGLRGARQAVAEIEERVNVMPKGGPRSELIVERERRRADLIQWIDQYVRLTGAQAPIKRIVEVDLNEKWMAAQNEACNEAYRRRWMKSVGMAEVVKSEITEEFLLDKPAKSGENDAEMRENTTET